MDRYEEKAKRWLEMFGRATEDNPLNIPGWRAGDPQPDGWESGFKPSGKLLQVKQGLQRMRGFLEDEGTAKGVTVRLTTDYGEMDYPAPWLRYVPLLVHFAGEEFNEQRRMTMTLIATVQELQTRAEQLEYDNEVLRKQLMKTRP